MRHVFKRRNNYIFLSTANDYLNRTTPNVEQYALYENGIMFYVNPIHVISRRLRVIKVTINLHLRKKFWYVFLSMKVFKLCRVDMLMTQQVSNAKYPHPIPTFSFISCDNSWSTSKSNRIVIKSISCCLIDGGAYHYPLERVPDYVQVDEK